MIHVPPFSTTPNPPFRWRGSALPFGTLLLFALLVSGGCRDEGAQAGDVVLTMGAGDVWKVADEMVSRLESGH